MTIQKRATLVASLVAGVLAVLKLIVGLFSGSVALLASAIDSLLDLAISLFNYIALHGSEKPADFKFNYGRGKLEALSSVIEGVIIALSGLFIMHESLSALYDDRGLEYLRSALIVMCVSFFATLLLVLFLSKVARESGGMVVRADLLHYKVDLLSNGAVLASLFLVFVSGLHFIDAIVGAGIASYIIYSALGLIRDGVYTLLDRAMDVEKEAEIRAVLDSFVQESTPHSKTTKNPHEALELPSAPQSEVAKNPTSSPCCETSENPCESSKNPSLVPRHETSKNPPKATKNPPHDSSRGITSYHTLRTREAGSVRFVDVHLVFRRDSSLFEAHEISDEIEVRIRALDSKFCWNITTHLDPYDDSKTKECI